MSSGKAFIGKPAPDFTATAVMPDGQFKDIKLSDYRGKFMCLSNYKCNQAVHGTQRVSYLVWFQSNSENLMVDWSRCFCQLMAGVCLGSC